MSTGQWLGAIIGVVLGILTFGTFGWLGIVYGAIIGYTVGGYIDPVKPDVKQPGAPAQQGLQMITNVIGNPIFDVLGTAKITGQLLFFGKEYSVAVWYRPAKGVRAISGYKYYASWALGICMGVTDCLYTIFRDQDPVWSGELVRPPSGGEATIQIEGVGTMVFYFGTDDQMPNTNAGLLLPDPTLNTGHRHLCWAYFHACFMNEYNRMPSMSFIVRKTPPMFSEGTSQIQTYDINPAHALWFILAKKVGLSEEWLHSGDFLDVAITLYNEGRGISILFDTHQAAQNYLEAINSHVDNILRYGSDGKFHPKLIRYDYDPDPLPVIDESKLLEEPTFSRRSWIDTINEVKVQYSEILGEWKWWESESMWAWFKLNEGAGNTIIDYSPVGVNGTVGINPPTTPTADEVAQFWSLNPGFGTGYTVGGYYYNSAHARRATPSRNTGYCSLVAFFKPISYGFFGAGFVQLGETASLNYIGVAYLNGSPYNLILSVSSGVSATSAYTLNLGTWYCIYAYSRALANDNALYVRKSGDSDWTQALLNIGTATNAASNQSLITFLGVHNNGINVEGGDVVYFADSTPGGIITLEQVTKIFNNLKSRYGMT